MRHAPTVLSGFLLLLGARSASSDPDAGATAGAEPPTWTEVGALFARRCTVCHGGEAPDAGLSLETHEGTLRGAEGRSIIAGGEPGNSELLRRLTGGVEPRMPLDGPPFLAASEIDLAEVDRRRRAEGRR